MDYSLASGSSAQATGIGATAIGGGGGANTEAARASGTGSIALAAGPHMMGGGVLITEGANASGAGGDGSWRGKRGERPKFHRYGGWHWLLTRLLRWRLVIARTRQVLQLLQSVAGPRRLGRIVWRWGLTL